MLQSRKVMTRPKNLNGEGRSYPHDVHWYTNDDGWELMQREMFEMNVMEISDYHRRKILRKNAPQRLEILRKKHRLAGIDDVRFLKRKRGA